ncbi:hypothetical protein LSH36_524g01073 [Paralvinella palmiformis]|uniref:Adiponectin receptor protein n=1 Tax=Paralvinella palmiformis TaxID=53620 RepID=A0AAD9J898_9ANNE|nr:hypothetical protein LSH36_524g01073 [Paralvinella palmiformis]
MNSGCCHCDWGGVEELLPSFSSVDWTDKYVENTNCKHGVYHAGSGVHATNHVVKRRRGVKLGKLGSTSDIVTPSNPNHEAPHIADLPISTGEVTTLMDLIPDHIKDLSGRVEDQLRSLPGHAMHKAEEFGEELIALPGKAMDAAEEIARKMWDVVHQTHLPDWLKDNEFLIAGHRPQLHSFMECFKSVFRIHTETGNIWTHLLGFLAFVWLAFSFGVTTPSDITIQEKIAFYAFFAGAILCMGFSWVFHTVYCHSEHIGKVFSKLDYCGIALLTMGSFIPWCYYSFYTSLNWMIFYIIFITLIGTLCIVVSMWDKFAEPHFRPLRAGVFIGFGLSAIVPISHVIIVNGFWETFYFAALGWMILMAFFYISGALIYAARIPERIWPGKFDIWFQSHQIFHVFVIAAAFVHYHGISEIANNRLNGLSFSSFSTFPLD